jgi:hypothetical protein
VSPISKRALFWSPRVLAIAFIAFLSLFALDVFSEGLGFWRTILALGIHLIPCFVLTAALILAWRWEWVGAALYGAAGVLYIVTVSGRRLPLAVKANWLLVVAGPALAVAALFLANWLKRGRGLTR